MNRAGEGVGSENLEIRKPFERAVRQSDVSESDIIGDEDFDENVAYVKTRKNTTNPLKYPFEVQEGGFKERRRSRQGRMEKSKNYRSGNLHKSHYINTYNSKADNMQGENHKNQYKSYHEANEKVPTFRPKESGDFSELDIPDELFFTEETKEEPQKITENLPTQPNTNISIHKRTKRRAKNARNYQKSQPKSFVTQKDRLMIKTIPLFFENQGENEDEINLGESIYTQISKEMLTKENAKVNNIYEQLTSD